MSHKLMDRPSRSVTCACAASLVLSGCVSYPTQTGISQTLQDHPRPVVETEDQARNYLHAVRTDMVGTQQDLQALEMVLDGTTFGAGVAAAAGVALGFSGHYQIRTSLLAASALGMDSTLPLRLQRMVIDRGLEALNCVDTKAETAFAGMARFSADLTYLQQKSDALPNFGDKLAADKSAFAINQDKQAISQQRALVQAAQDNVHSLKKQNAAAIANAPDHGAWKAADANGDSNDAVYTATDAQYSQIIAGIEATSSRQKTLKTAALAYRADSQAWLAVARAGEAPFAQATRLAVNTIIQTTNEQLTAAWPDSSAWQKAAQSISVSGGAPQTTPTPPATPANAATPSPVAPAPRAAVYISNNFDLGLAAPPDAVAAQEYAGAQAFYRHALALYQDAVAQLATDANRYDSALTQLWNQELLELNAAQAKASADQPQTATPAGISDFSCSVAAAPVPLTVTPAAGAVPLTTASPKYTVVLGISGTAHYVWLGATPGTDLTIAPATSTGLTNGTALILTATPAPNSTATPYSLGIIPDSNPSAMITIKFTVSDK